MLRVRQTFCEAKVVLYLKIFFNAFMTNRPSPPLNALRAFEAAARLRSFTGAAKELGVSSAAVGQSVRSLEAYLNLTLFHRNADGLELTKRAAEALPIIGQAFDLMAEATRILGGPAGGTGLRISFPPSLGVNWLAPRLPKFYDRHPGIEVNIDAGFRLANIARGEVDLAIRFGPGGYTNLFSERILDETIVPICSPCLREKHNIRSIADLEHAPLVHLVIHSDDKSWPTWPSWAKLNGLDSARFAGGPTFFGTSALALVLRAVVEGQGVALSGLISAIDDLQTGKLVVPLGETGAVKTQFGYDLICSAAIAESRPVAAFRSWVKAEARETKKAIARILGSNGRAT